MAFWGRNGRFALSISTHAVKVVLFIQWHQEPVLPSFLLFMGVGEIVILIWRAIGIHQICISYVAQPAGQDLFAQFLDLDLLLQGAYLFCSLGNSRLFDIGCIERNPRANQRNKQGDHDQ